MSAKQKSWFKSAFDTDDITTTSQPTASTTRKLPNTRKRSASTATIPATTSTIKCNATTLNATIDLTLDDDVDLVVREVPLNTNDIAADNWLDNFAPHTVEELAIHAKKIEELQQWLRGCTASNVSTTSSRHHVPMLCITGPAGAGKTATLRLCASAAGFDVQEWVQPVDVELSTVRRYADDTVPAFAESQTLLFEQFLFRASRYGSLFEATARRRLVLVEDFPNVFVKDATGFEEILQRYSEYGKAPIVFVCTDSRSRKLDLAYTLFGEAIRTKYGIDSMAFNAVSSTLLKRALKRIAAIMTQPAFRQHYKTVASDAVDSIVLTAQGDLRNAMITMHMAAQKGSGTLPMQRTDTKKSSSSSSVRSKKGANKLQSMGCDETITMMHALGRVLNPKYSDDPADRLLHSPEQLADDFTTQPQNFINLLYANYAAHFRDIDDTVCAIDALSSADRLLSEWRDDACALHALNVAVRGLMTANRRPTSGWLPIRGQHKRTDDVRKDAVEELRRACGVRRSVSLKVMTADYRTFAKVVLDGRKRLTSGSLAAVNDENCDEQQRDTEVKRLEQAIEW